MREQVLRREFHTHQKETFMILGSRRRRARQKFCRSGQDQEFARTPAAHIRSRKEEDTMETSFSNTK